MSINNGGDWRTNFWSMGISHSRPGKLYGGAEEKKPSFMLFTSEQVNAALGAVDPIYLTEAYLYRDLDHDQDGIETEVPKSFSLFFRKMMENTM